jgi:hypothetical protein
MLKTITSTANTVGSLEYKGLWNAATNTPTLVSSVGTQGDYYVVSVAGTTNLDGVTTWDEGDWAIFNGSVWQLFQDGQDGVFATLTVSNYAAFADNAKATFGTGAGDLQIYHDGNNSYVSDTGTGGLYLKGSNEIALRNASNGNIFLGLTGGSAYVYHNGSAKLSTTATGIDISGTATMDGLLVEGETAGQGASIEVHATTTEFGDALLIAKSDNASNSIHAGVKIQGSNNPFYIYQSNGSNTNKLRFNYNSMSDAGGQMTIDSNGDISFFDPTGTTPKFFWDASAESLGIGTSSPAQAKLDILLESDYSSHTGHGLSILSNAANAYTSLYIGTDDTIDSAYIQSAGKNTSFTSKKLLLNPNGGNVGIGTSSTNGLKTAILGATGYPATSGTTQTGVLRISGGTGLYNVLDMGVNEATDTAWMQATRANSLGTYDNLVINPNGGNVGIGTSSPVTLKSATTLQVSGNAKLGDDNGRGLLSLGDIASIGANVGIWRGAAGAYAGTGNYLNLGGYDGITFTTGAADISAQTERARLTSDGNFLAGKTSSDLGATAGIELSGQYDVGYFTRSGDKPLVVNRLSSDGTILDIRKDGTSVGSIGVVNANNLTIGGEVASHAGMEFGTNQIAPRSGGTSVDATVDLGYFSLRWKDLYLSGGVYLGGTGAANLLDDYESGTWTPVLADAVTAGNTATMTADGRYTKIGRLITVECQMLDIDTTGMTAGNNIFIRGLPEVVSVNSRAIGSVRLDRVNFTNYVVVVGGGNTSYALLSDQIDSAQDVVLTVAAITATGSDITFTLQYTI